MKLPDPKDFKLKALPLASGSIVASAALNDKEVLKRILKEIASLDSRLATFKNKAYGKECLKIAPIWLFNEASSEALEMFRKLTVWDEKNQTLIILIFDYEGKLISYKRRRYRGGKWITRKGTHPNRQCIMRIKNGYGPIYIIEGHHDALSATLLDIDDVDTFNFVTIPTVGYKVFNDIELEALEGRNVYFLPDLGDKDSGSIKCMTQLAEQVKGIAAHTRVANLKAFLKENGITCESDKLDLSEALSLWTEGSSVFINTLHYYCDRGIVFEGEAF